MLFNEFKLPNGQTLKNRLVKAAMEENMATANRAPSEKLISLYRRWSNGGTGLLITGNVMVDSSHMTGAGGVVLENNLNIDRFEQWARAAKEGGSQVWMQINHPGRQVLSALNEFGLAPSAVNLDLGKYSSRFAPAREMTGDDIENLIERFVKTATLAEQAGFDGVEIHAAHGYLVSQFLSPLVNKRTDQWGGSVENRARLLLTIIDQVRAQVSPEFAVAVKINSADFQRGGFQPDDALTVVKLLESRKVDLVELSGGSYEAPAMQGSTKDERTLAREAYFLEFAKDIAGQTSLPVMTTGGIARQAVAEEVLSNGVDLVGIATGLALLPELPLRWQKNETVKPALKEIKSANKTFAAIATMAQVRQMMLKHSDNNDIKQQAPYWLAILKDQLLDQRNTKRYKQWKQQIS
jgi:2,4-dienoyl-CoA reductase-like NADH-dependent reductase (Old Yellow Enzyme family)